MLLSCVHAPSRASNALLKLLINLLLLLLRKPRVEIVISEPNRRRPPAVVRYIELRVHSGRVLRLHRHLLRMAEASVHVLVRLRETLLLARVVCVGVLVVHHHPRVTLRLEHHALATKWLVGGLGTCESTRASLFKEDSIVLGVGDLAVQRMVALVETWILACLVI